ncbi:MAG: hypothetical protein ACRDRC_05565 [Pseudonocardiaceae bacterium]
MTHLGLIARLVSPALALAVTSSDLLGIDLARMQSQRVLGGAFPYRCRRTLAPMPVTTTRNPNRSRSALPTCSRAGFWTARFRDLVEATMPLSVSRHVLWDNVASTVNGAASMTATCQTGLCRPVTGDRVAVASGDHL